MTIKSAIVSKLVWTVLGFIVLYLAASTFNLVPKSMQNAVVWLQANITLFIVATCFMVCLYVFFRIKMRRKVGYE
jgi:hypothetical protein